jgi:hypothetical protein
MADAQTLRNVAGGIADNGTPFTWRFAFSRHPRDFQQVINDPERGPWQRTLPDGQVQAGHTDAYEQIVPINEQIAWRHVFSDGIERDSGDVLLELMEFAIQWRTENGLPTSAFSEDRNPDLAPAKKAVKKAAKKAPAKKAQR